MTESYSNQSVKRGIKTTHLHQLFCHYHDQYFDNKAQALFHQEKGCVIAEEVQLAERRESND